jgi:CRP-like cAMP-binding protein
MDKMFLTNHYRVLEVMHQHTIPVAGQKYCPLSQEEVAKELNLSRIFVNRVFTDLKEAGYISMIAKGKWQLSDKANKMIDVTKKL